MRRAWSWPHPLLSTRLSGRIIGAGSHAHGRIDIRGVAPLDYRSQPHESGADALSARTRIEETASDAITPPPLYTGPGDARADRSAHHRSLQAHPHVRRGERTEWPGHRDRQELPGSARERG